MCEIILVMMHNPPATVEKLKGTESSSINTFNIMNHFCMVTIMGEIRPQAIFKTRTTHFIKGTELVLSRPRGDMELGNVGVCRAAICDIAK